MRAERERCCVSGASYNNGIRMVRGSQALHASHFWTFGDSAEEAAVSKIDD
jgi:hypothetical protein